MQKLLMYLQLLPAIIGVVRAIEALLPESGKGQVKAAALRELMETLDASAATMWPVIDQMVTIVVKLMNAGKDPKPTV